MSSKSYSLTAILFFSVACFFISCIQTASKKNVGQTNDSPIDSNQTEKINNKKILKKIIIEEALDEANKKFFYNGEPISPELVNEFLPWLSDENPITITVDVVAAYQTNEYNGAIEYNDSIAKVIYGENIFEYKYLGKLKNGIHVVDFYRGESNSGIFETLLFISFRIRKNFDDSEKLSDQLLMSLEKSYIVGDRQNAKITLTKNTVIIDRPINSDAEVVINF